MKVRTRKIIIGVAFVSLLLVGAAKLSFRRTQVVDGLSRQDLVQIRNGVRSEIWRQAFPGGALGYVKYLPRRVWRALATNIDSPERWENVSGQHTMRNGQSTFFEENTWLVFTSDGNALLLEKRKCHWWVNGHN
jgi:hypothetical protein